MPVYTSHEDMRRAAPVADVLPIGHEGKNIIWGGGAKIRCRDYNRASQDTHGSEYSVTTQRTNNEETRQHQGWKSLGSYTDNDRSASRKNRGKRPDYERMLEDIRRDPGDVLILFEMARGTRDLRVYLDLLELCQKRGPFLWHIGRNLYDVRDRSDRQTLHDMAVRAEGQSDSIGENVLAGLESQAKDGRPHGAVPFGYQRFKNPNTGRFDRQIPDDREQEGGWTAAGVVRRIFTMYLAGIPVLVISERLTAEGIPSPRLWRAINSGDQDRVKKWAHLRWTETGVYNILRNPAYIGVRMHRGDRKNKCRWERLVSDKTYFDAAKKMEMAAFRGERPLAAQTLLTCIPRCQCGRDVVFQKAHGTRVTDNYRCRRGCASVTAVDADRYVTRAVLALLTNAKAIQELNGRVDNSAEVAEAAAKVKKLNGELARWRDRVNDDEWPEVDEDFYLERRAKLIPKIREAEAVQPVGVSTAVTRMAGPDASEKWLNASLLERRECLRGTVKIVLHPAGRGRRNAPLEERIIITKAW